MNKNGARPHFQTERWKGNCKKNGAWHHFFVPFFYALLGTSVAISKKEKKG